MEWIEISITVERVVAEVAATLFDDFAANGIIEEDVPEQQDLLTLVMYGDTTKSPEAWIEEIRIRLQENDLTDTAITAKIVTDTDWYQAWQQYIEPTEILPHLVIKPAWQAYEKRTEDTVIEIDSELSFGTGAHETTQTCAKLMAKYGKDKQSCLDIGTGTGILLFVAHYLGIARLIGIDIDAKATEQAKANALSNQIHCEIICGDLARDFHGQADLVLANLTVDPLKFLLPVIGEKMTADGILIISGIIDERYDEIMPYIKKDWQIMEEAVQGAWHTFALQKVR